MYLPPPPKPLGILMDAAIMAEHASPVTPHSGRGGWGRGRGRGGTAPRGTAASGPGSASPGSAFSPGAGPSRGRGGRRGGGSAGGGGGPGRAGAAAGDGQPERPSQEWREDADRECEPGWSAVLLHESFKRLWMLRVSCFVPSGLPLRVSARTAGRVRSHKAVRRLAHGYCCSTAVTLPGGRGLLRGRAHHDGVQGAERAPAGAHQRDLSRLPGEA